MKKICFLIGNLNNSGGTERVTSLIANELCKKGYMVSILSLVNGAEPFFELNPEVKIYGIYSKHVSFKKNFINVIWKIRKFLKYNKVDTLIVVDSISCMFTVPALMGLKINHLCWEHFNFNVDLGVFFRRLGRRLAARHCNYVVTLTEKDKAFWEDNLTVINSKIVPIVNPSPYGVITHNPSLDLKVVLGMGRLTYQKGFDMLIDAWAEVCLSNFDWKLRIVGSGEDELKLKKQAKELGILERIDFVPVTNDVEKYYSTSSFYCLSSRFEGFGMVMIEAQAFGLPVVAFDCDAGPSDIIEHGKNGYLVEKDNPKLLAHYINLVIEKTDKQYDVMVSDSKCKNDKFILSNVINEWIKII
ncbi:glycosyltransferase family 4 protein [Psychrobacter cryohalolentis]|uniref:glycosyltransferase family 4 protein n=1 Tax=Psychrobacter cryohalolentis TaxID=330922 RepID=UPI003F83DF84